MATPPRSPIAIVALVLIQGVVAPMARSANPDRPGGAVAGAEPFSGAPPGVLVTAPGTASTPLIGLHSDHFDPVSRGQALRAQIAREGIPRQPRLSAREREIETAFAEWIEGDPSRAVEAAARLAEANGSPDQPIFEVDSIKRLVPEYGSDGKPSSDDEYLFRLEHNHALHPAAVALARMAFIDRLDVLATLPAGDPAKRVFVTNGGCAAGKGSLTEIVKNALGDKARFGAVWDAAGEGDALENAWVLRAAGARDIDVVFGYAQADPRTRYEGVLARAEGTGRVVDVLTFVNSYAEGARAFRAFLDSAEYRAAVADGKAVAFGIDPGEFDMASLKDRSKPAFPDLRNLNPSGSLRPEDMAPPPDKLAALEAALGILEAYVAKAREEGKDPLPVARGALGNALKFAADQPEAVGAAMQDSYERIFGD